jgi:hypothetical protein
VVWRATAAGSMEFVLPQRAQRFSLACLGFYFLFRGVQRGYFSFYENAQRDHEGRRVIELSQGPPPERSRIQIADYGSMSDSAVCTN